MLEQFFRLLFDNPLILLIVGSWVLGAVGSALRKARERAEEERRAGRRMPSTTSEDAMGGAPTVETRPSEEDVAEKLRRILGEMQSGSAPAPVRSEEPPPVPRREARPHSFDEDTEEEVREVAAREEPRTVPVRASEPPPLPQRGSSGAFAPRPFVPSTLGRVPVQVQSHVGEAMQRRATPASGAVAATQLGGLGGRGPATVRRRKGGTETVDLSDLRSAIILREVLDRPLALREEWGR